MAIVEDCLERFFASGGIAVTSTRPDRSLAGRKLFRLHSDYETIQAIYAELVNPTVAGERLAPWQVIATAVFDHIEAVDSVLPPDWQSIFT